MSNSVTLDQIDQQIAKWKELQSNMALKLVDLDGMSGYQGIRNNLYQGTTALTASKMRDTIFQLWTLSALLDDAISKTDSIRKKTPMPWEKEKWMHDLSARMTMPVIAVPAPGNMDLSDTLSAPTLTLGSALTQLVNCYDQVMNLIHQVESRTVQLNQKKTELTNKIQQLGLQRFQTEVDDVASQIQVDPLGVSIESFGSVESKINRFVSAAGERQALEAALSDGEKRIKEFSGGIARLTKTAQDAQTMLGQSRPIPTPDFQDLLNWMQTLRSKLNDLDVSSFRVGLSRWQEAIEKTITPITQADAYNRDQIGRLQEIQGRFSAAQAKAAAIRTQPPQVDRLASQIRTALNVNPKDVSTLERLLEAYERLVLK